MNKAEIAQKIVDAYDERLRLTTKLLERLERLKATDPNAVADVEIDNAEIAVLEAEIDLYRAQLVS